MPELLPSQQYSFDLVKAAVRRGSIIVAMRRWRQWVGAVPELETYENVLHPNSRQCAYISPGNYPSGFETLIAAIR